MGSESNGALGDATQLAEHISSLRSLFLCQRLGRKTKALALRRRATECDWSSLLRARRMEKFLGAFRATGRISRSGCHQDVAATRRSRSRLGVESQALFESA